MTLASGKKLGPYEIVAPIGAGGMGEVYRAKDTRPGRDVGHDFLPMANGSLMWPQIPEQIGYSLHPWPTAEKYN